MVRDYATRPANKKSNKRVWLSVGIIALAVTAPLSMFYLRYSNDAAEHNNQVLPVDINHASTMDKPVTAKQVKSESAKTVEYDFYTVLPKMKVEPVSPTSKQKMLVLQVASLQDKSDANTLQQRLTESGYRAFVEKYQGPNATWYRVMTGPYANQRAAATDRSKLAEQRLVSVLVRQSK